MSSLIRPSDSSSRGNKISNTSNTPSNTRNANPPKAPSSTSLNPSPPLQEPQTSTAVPSPNNSNLNLNPSSNMTTPPPQAKENTQIPPTSNSNSNMDSAPTTQQSREILKPLPPSKSSNTPSASSPNASSIPSPPFIANSNPKPNPYLKVPPPAAVVSPTPPVPQGEPVLQTNSSPSQITPTTPLTPVPPNQPDTRINSPSIQLLPSQTPPAGLSLTQQANAKAGLSGVKPPPPFPLSPNATPYFPYVISGYDGMDNKYHRNKHIGISPLYIAIGVVAMLLVILCVVARKKKKLEDLVFHNGQHTKSGNYLSIPVFCRVLNQRFKLVLHIKWKFVLFSTGSTYKG